MSPTNQPDPAGEETRAAEETEQTAAKGAAEGTAPGQPGPSAANHR